MIDENRASDRPGVVPVSNFLGRLGEVTGLLTTNYDLLVEYALGTKEMNYGMRGEVLTGRGPYPVSQWPTPSLLPAAFQLPRCMEASPGTRTLDIRMGGVGSQVTLSSLLLHQRRASPIRFGMSGTWQRESWVGRIASWSSDSLLTPTTGLYSNILLRTVVVFATSPLLTFAPTSSVSLASGREPPLLR